MRGQPPAALIRELQRVPLFEGLDVPTLIRIDRLATAVDISPGTHLTREGQPGREAFIILEGDAVVTISGRPCAVLRAGDVVGEMALVDNGPVRQR